MRTLCDRREAIILVEPKYRAQGDEGIREVFFDEQTLARTLVMPSPAERP